MKSRVLVVVMFLSLSTATFGAPPDFAQVDANGDGLISKKEARNAGLDKLVANWPKADQNKDNQLGQQEFSNYMETIGQQPGGKPPSFAEADKNSDGKLNPGEAADASLIDLMNDWQDADKNGDSVLDQQEYQAFIKQVRENQGVPKKSFSVIDQDNNKTIDKAEARKAGMDRLVAQWKKADKNGDSVLSQSEFSAFTNRDSTQQSSNGSSENQISSRSAREAVLFADVDKNKDQQVDQGEARAAGLNNLASNWKEADSNGDTVLSKDEFKSFMRRHDTDLGPSGTPKVVGKDKFKSPETVVWDEKNDVYLVSNINGKLRDLDDDGFISRVTPDGKVASLKWIDGADRDITLNGPKGMTFLDDQLVVVDVNSVHFFDRTSGKLLRTVPIPSSYNLNDPAVNPKTKAVYVSDLGGDTSQHPGAVYKLNDKGPVLIAKSTDLERPDGLIWYDNKLLVTPFGAHAKTLYYLDANGRRTNYTDVPTAQLDGLLALPDGTLIVTSWKGKAVFKVKNKKPQTFATDIQSPAQIGYDAKRQRLLVPSLKDNELLIYAMK